jgi:hypothetical protein
MCKFYSFEIDTSYSLFEQHHSEMRVSFLIAHTSSAHEFYKGKASELLCISHVLFEKGDNII